MSEGLWVKKALSLLDVAVIVDELRRRIVDSYVDNVYEDLDGSYVFRLRSPSEDTLLLVKPGERSHITRHIARLKSGGKVQVIRKFINGLRVAGIDQVGFERIVKLSLVGKGLQYFVYVELIPRGIMVLTDANNKVLVASKELKVKDRRVVTGGYYALPPMFDDLRSLDATKWFSIISGHNNLVRGLIRGLGVPPEVVNEVLGTGYRNGEVTLDTVAKIREEIVRFIDNVISSPRPVIVAEPGGGYVSFLSFKPLKTYRDLRLLEFDSLNDAVDEYFLRYNESLLASRDSKELELEISKVTKLIDDLEKELSNLRNELDELKGVYEIVVNNYDRLEEVHECVRNTVKRRGWESVVKCGILDYDANTGSFKVLAGSKPLELSVRESTMDYMIGIRKKISNYEDKVKKVEGVIKELMMKREGLISERKSLDIPPLMRRVDWYDKFHWMITSDGCLAIGGRDAEQNEKLVRRYLGDDDIFVHADIRGAPVVILRCGGKVLERSIYEASVLAVCYSRGWMEGLAALDTFWVFGNQVSKRAPVGEYLARGSFMVYGKRNYVRDVKLELAIGVSISDRYYKLIVGPKDNVSSRCRFYAVLRPGSNSKESVAKNLLKFFVDCDKRLRYLDVNEIASRIPGPSGTVEYFKNT